MAQYDKFTKKYIKIRSNMIKRKQNSEFPAMFTLLGNLKNKKLLDLGCGFGEYAKIYSKHGAKVTGIDSSKNEIGYAKSQNIKNTNFFVHDLSKKLPFKNSEFDIITSSLVFAHLKNLKLLFKECYRILKPNAIMIFAIANPLLYQEKSLVGKFKILGRKLVFGNYFERRKITRKWAGQIPVEYYHKPLEDYFSAFLDNGFELIKFREPPLIQTPKKGNWHSKNPTFLVFKIKKK